MLKHCHIILAVVFFLWCTVDAKVEEQVQLKVFNHDFKASKAEMLEILKQANLEAHGYTKEVVSEIKDTSSGVVTFEKMHRYYKSVPCNEAAEAEKRLDALLGGALGPDVDAAFEKDMKGTCVRKVDVGKKCTVGVEIHFKGGSLVQKGRPRTKRSAGFCLVCFFCG